MDQRAPQPLRHRHLDQAVGSGEHQATEQLRADIVAVLAATGGAFSVECERIQRFDRQRRIEQGVRRHQRGAGRGRAAAHAGAERDALVDLQRDPERQVQRATHGVDRARAGVARDIARQVGDRTADGIHPHLARVDAPRGDDVAGTDQRVSEDVEADADVADGGRGEGGGGVGGHGRLDRCIVDRCCKIGPLSPDPSPTRGEGSSADPTRGVPRCARALLPCPLVGEGLGERGSVWSDPGITPAPPATAPPAAGRRTRRRR